MGKPSLGSGATKITKDLTAQECEVYLTSIEHKQQLIRVVRNRFLERFLDPVVKSREPSGFVMMAVACFMIETLQCFRFGLPSSFQPEIEEQWKHAEQLTKPQMKEKLREFKMQVMSVPEDRAHLGLQKLMFLTFFLDNPCFVSDPAIVGLEFYECIRNGLLHQSETKNGWKVTRKRGEHRFYWIGDDGHRIIHADRFIESMENYLCYYSGELEGADWDDPLWVNCRNKLNCICMNCMSEHTEIAME